LAKFVDKLFHIGPDTDLGKKGLTVFIIPPLVVISSVFIPLAAANSAAAPFATSPPDQNTLPVAGADEPNNAPKIGFKAAPAIKKLAIELSSDIAPEALGRLLKPPSPKLLVYILEPPRSAKSS
jgi:hypothetical protein